MRTVEKTVEIPQVLFLGLTCPLLSNDRCVVEAVQKTVEFPQLQYVDKVVDVPVVLPRGVQFQDKVVDMAVVVPTKSWS